MAWENLGPNCQARILPASSSTNRSKIPQFVDFHQICCYLFKMRELLPTLFLLPKSRNLLSSNKNVAVCGGQGAAWVTTHWPNQRLSRLQMVTAGAPHRKPWTKPRGSLSKNHGVVVWLLVCVYVFLHFFAAHCLFEGDKILYLKMPKLSVSARKRNRGKCLTVSNWEKSSFILLKDVTFCAEKKALKVESYAPKLKAKRPGPSDLKLSWQR